MIIGQMSTLRLNHVGVKLRVMRTTVCFALLLILSYSLFINEVNAAQIQFQKGVELSIESTRRSDTRLVEDADNESKGTIAPFISLRSQGLQTSFDVTASVVASASGESGDSDLRPKLLANSRRISKNKQLSFDASAVIERRIINSPFENSDNLFDSQSGENVVGWSLGPSYRRQIKNTTLGAAYSIGGAHASDTDDSRSFVQTASLLTRSQTPMKKLIAGTRLSTQHLNFESASSASSGSVQVFLDYEIRKNLNGEILVGREFVRGVDNFEDTGGNQWGVGFAWRPSKRLTFEAAYVERYFARQPRVVVSLDGKRSSVQFSWTRELGTSAISEFDLNKLETNTGASDSSTAEENNSPAGDATDITRVPLFQEFAKINELISIAYSINGRVSGFTASVSSRQQTDLVSTEQTDSTLLELSLNRQISQSSSATVTFTTGESELIRGGSIDDSKQSINRIKLGWKMLF